MQKFIGATVFPSVRPKSTQRAFFFFYSSSFQTIAACSAFFFFLSAWRCYQSWHTLEVRESILSLSRGPCSFFSLPHTFSPEVIHACICFDLSFLLFPVWVSGNCVKIGHAVSTVQTDRFSFFLRQTKTAECSMRCNSFAI